MRSIMGVTGSMLMIGALVACGGSDSSTGSNDGCGERSIAVAAAADGSAVFPPLPTDEKGLAAVVADTFCAEFTITFADGYVLHDDAAPVNREDAACIGDRLVDELGVDRVRQLGFGRGAWSLIGFGLSNAVGAKGLTRSEAETIAEVFVGCTSSWKLLLINSVTEGADEISAETTRCIDRRVADGTAKTILIGELDRAYSDPSQSDATPFSELIAPLEKAFDACLADDEQDLVDWN